MKNVFLFIFLFLGLSSFSHAQSSSSESVQIENSDKYKVETNRFWSNWFVNLGGGAQVFFGDHNKQMSFGDRLSPALDVSVGKWFTPGLGLRLMYSGLSYKGATQNGSHSTGDAYDASQWLYEQKFDVMHLHSDVLFNLSNLLLGYREDRFYSVTPYVGFGWMLTWETPRSREVTANLGVLNQFRLNPSLDLTLDVRGTVVNDRFDGELGGRKEEGALAVTVGLTYKFKQRGWNRSTVKTVETVKYDESQLRALRDKMNEMERANADLNNRLADAGKQPRETVVKNIAVVAPCLITFPLGKSTLDNAGRANLGFFAKAIKAQGKDAVYTITGYADKGTGSNELNERLSKARAQAVYDILVTEFGVPSSQLKVAAQGGVDNMFYDDPRLSRAVITEVK